MPDVRSIEVTIPNGAEALSAAFSIGNGIPLAVRMPGTWLAASLTFQGSTDGQTFVDLYDAGAQVEVAVDASQGVNLTGANFAGWPYLKVRSGKSGAAVDQTADRVLVFQLRQAAPR